MARSIILDRDAVHQQLARIAQVAGKPATIPVLGHALVEHEGDSIRLTASDMDIWLSVTIPAQSSKFGPLAVPAKDFHDVIAALPAGAQAEVTWAKEDATQIKIKSGRTRFTLPLMAASDFPLTPRADIETSFEAAGAIFNALLDRAKWAVSKEETRYYLQGVYLHITGDERLACVATDGHMLGRGDGALPKGAERLTKGIIIPAAAVKLIATLIGDDDATADISISPTHFRLDREDEVSTWSLTTRLIDGEFPDYARVIPARDSLIEADVEAAVLAKALARVAILAPEAHSIKIEGAKGLLTISTQGADGREAAEEIDAAWATKPPEKAIGFNAKFLKAALDGIAADTVVLALSPQGDGPCLLTPRGRTDTLAVVMPVRV